MGRMIREAREQRQWQRMYNALKYPRKFRNMMYADYKIKVDSEGNISFDGNMSMDSFQVQTGDMFIVEGTEGNWQLTRIPGKFDDR